MQFLGKVIIHFVIACTGWFCSGTKLFFITQKGSVRHVLHWSDENMYIASKQQIFVKWGFKLKRMIALILK